jgi:hypothetical protein
MQNLGAGHLLVLVIFVALVLDSRRLHALARSATRGRRDSIGGQGIPPGANPDRVGLGLGQIQMRHHVDWLDGGTGWEGPEILPVDEPEVAPIGESDGGPADGGPSPEPQPSRALPLLWEPFPALAAAGADGDWPQAETPARTNVESCSGAVLNGSAMGDPSYRSRLRRRSTEEVRRGSARERTGESGSAASQCLVNGE